MGKYTIKAVIGANCGDEGKGNVTGKFCALCAGEGPTIGVLTNGGPQRGHTVVRGKIRHIFQHLSAGTLDGADTWFAPSFMVNPMQFAREYRELAAMGYSPRVYIDPDCRFTTPYDMMQNQYDHRLSGDNHTCGMGIWETCSRYMAGENAATVREFLEMSENEKILYLVRIRERTLLRMKEASPSAGEWEELLASDILLARFISDMDFLCRIAGTVTDSRILRLYPNIVLENGQGLLLDWSDDEQLAVYSTPSRTGIHDILNVTEKIFTGETVEICYVTRTYLTRHGDGPLDRECRREELGRMVREETNHTNAFQGHFRYGAMETEALYNRINRDFAEHGMRNTYRKALAVTHVDQLQPGAELRGIRGSFDEYYEIGQA